MAKSPEAFRTISEVADWLGIPAHVLRFWESKFTQVKPVKRAGGRRYYRPGDMQLLGGIKKLLHDDGLTIKGVQKILRESGVGHVSELSQPLDEMATDISPEFGPGRPEDDIAPEAADETAGEPAGDTVVHFQGRRSAPQPQASQIDMDLAPADSESSEPQADDPPPVAAGPPPEPRPAPPQSGAPEPAPLPLLSRLSRIAALDSDQARRAAPLAQALRDWLESTAAARAC
jgi:DNA-binding transcriptional MerR regulator